MYQEGVRMKKFIVVSSIIVVALLVVAAFFDLQIAEYIYNPKSVFAKAFAAVGMVPQSVVLLLSPPMALAVLFEKRRGIRPAVGIGAAAGILLVASVSIYGAVNGAMHENKVPPVFLVALVCLIMVLVFIIMLPFAKRRPSGLLFTALTGFLVVTAGAAILQTLKTFWGRQRFFTMDDAAVQFTAWYLPQSGGGEDAFKSFPSGHSFSAMCAVWFALWPRFIDGLKKYTRLIFALALIFGLTVMASRMIYGRHFLSDVTVGAALSLAFFALAAETARCVKIRGANC
jgi:membrane-associated phospholipid phosphatase